MTRRIGTSAIWTSPVSTALIGLIGLYRLTLSPWVGQGCRFSPTCSVYAREAILGHGAARGLWLMARRLSRCHPWGGSGYDPVPARAEDNRHHDHMCGHAERRRPGRSAESSTA
jgi:putative membrane protein insertion efficiency factor